MKKTSFLSLFLVLAMVLSLIVLPASADAAELSLPNGDFENGSEGWTLTGYPGEIKADEWATNNTTSALSLWISDSEEAAGSIAYTLTLDAGTYYFTFRMEGAAMESGLRYSIMSGETVLAAGTETYTTSGWDVWTDFATESFTLETTADVTFTLSGTQPAGYWGHLDDVKLFGTMAETPEIPEEPEVLPQIALVSDFENGTEGWVLKGYSSEVAADQWATGNTTKTLSLWLSDDAEAEGGAMYTVELAPGTYCFTFDMEGAEMSSGLGYVIVTGETVLTNDTTPIVTTGWDKWATFTTKSFTLEQQAEVSFAIFGTQPAGYWGHLDNLVLCGNGELAVKDPDPVDANIYVPYIKGTGGDFIRGMDVSSVLSVLNSGAVFKDYSGNELSGQGFFNLLAKSGTNWIRLRVWNDPFDANGNGYGGGNCDVNAAKTMGLWATNAGQKVLIDFHYSDFWADPGKQQAPKAWAGYSVDQKAEALKEYTYNSLKTLLGAGVDVGMVQIGNETTGSMCGVSNWADRCKLFSAGAEAVRRIAEEYGKEIKVAIHFTNPERAGAYASYAKQLSDNGVDYDVFASSYYPYWHGTLSNLTSVLKNVADTYGKEVVVAETSWAYTLEDGDGHDNTVRKGNNDSTSYPFSVQGQADQLVDVIKAVKNVGDAGLGVFYWESAWIPVPGETKEERAQLWEQHGSGWASSYAGEYDPKDAGVWYGGSAWDNQAMFDFSGNPLESLKTYKYLQTGTSGFEITVTDIESPELVYTVGDTLTLPESLTVSYSFGTPEVKAVVWSEDSVAAVDMTKAGTYTVTGTIDGELEATCTVTVKPANLLLNPGFEDGDMSMYVSSQAYAKRTSDDPYAGSRSLHFYNSASVDFTTEQTITLTPGCYEFSLFGQGGNVGDDAKTYAYVKIGEEVLTADFALTGWCNWVNPTIAFEIKEETAVTVGVNVTAAGGAWGTFDEWYLCEDLDAEPSTPPSDPTNPGLGDSTNVLLLTVTMLAAFAAAMVILPKRKRV